MSGLLITGGTVVDQNGSRPADVRIDNGVVIEVFAREVGQPARASEPERDEGNLDATGCVIAPGFVDLHAHLREPGTEEAETIETGSRAAALGGFTCVVA
ncbi:MAG TPA: dihydroorotase, partial [Ilumatobacter sp.]|nr:dihydroorotase [Ilumatobacter sp.]